MDMKALREEAMAATARFFSENRGFLPGEDSEEWEEEYRRQFELAKKRNAMKRPADATRNPAVALTDKRKTAWPELSGAPAEKRWAVTLRADRLKDIQSDDIRGWLAGTWTSSKDWIDTRDLALPVFLHRVGIQYAEHRRQSEEKARALRAERQVNLAAGEAVQREVRAAGITAQGLVELIDVSPRTAPASLKLKLAEFSVGGRGLRVFESDNPAILMVIENGETGRSEYGIERDEGLVVDLRLFAHAAALEPMQIRPRKS
jgi:hypothetical protein